MQMAAMTQALHANLHHLCARAVVRYTETLYRYIRLSCVLRIRVRTKIKRREGMPCRPWTKKKYYRAAKRASHFESSCRLMEHHDGREAQIHNRHSDSVRFGSTYRDQVNFLYISTNRRRRRQLS